MSTTPWDILGIGDDADAKAIKRAYARALKSTRPDEDPIGFQRLNDAYEWALGALRHRDANATPPTAPDEGPPTPDALPELGRPVDAPPDLPPPIPEPESPPVAAPDEGRGFDFGAFFDALAPRLAADRPAVLQSWLDEHPDLYSIDLKWALIPHVVDALARSIEAIRPRPDNVAALMVFFGVDARLRRHPALAPALDHIDAAMAQWAAAPASMKEHHPAFRSELDIALDAETPEAEVGNLQRQINLSLDGRGKVLTQPQARTLSWAISHLSPRWRVLLAFLPPHRQRDAEQHLAPVIKRLEHWEQSGVDLPNLALVRKIAQRNGTNGPKALLSLLRIVLASAFAALLFLRILPDDLTTAGDGLIAAATVIVGMASALAAVFWLAELTTMLSIAAVRRFIGWIKR